MAEKKKLTDAEKEVQKALEKVSKDIANTASDPKFGHPPPQAQVPQQQALPQLRTGAPMQMMQFPVGVSSPLDLQTVMSYFQAANAIQNKPIQESMALRQNAQQEQSVALDQAGKRYQLERSNWESPFLQQQMLTQNAMLRHGAARDLLQTDMAAQNLSDARTQSQWARDDRPLHLMEQRTRQSILESQDYTYRTQSKWLASDLRQSHELGRLQLREAELRINSLLNPQIDQKQIDSLVSDYVNAADIYDPDMEVNEQKKAQYAINFKEAIARQIADDPRRVNDPIVHKMAKQYADWNTFLQPASVNLEWIESQDPAGFKLFPNSQVNKINRMIQEDPDLYYKSKNVFQAGLAGTDIGAKEATVTRITEAIKNKKIAGIVPIKLGAGSDIYGLAIANNDETISPIHVGDQALVYNLSDPEGNPDLARELWDQVNPKWREGVISDSLHDAPARSSEQEVFRKVVGDGRENVEMSPAIAPAAFQELMGIRKIVNEWGADDSIYQWIKSLQNPTWRRKK